MAGSGCGVGASARRTSLRPALDAPALDPTPLNVSDGAEVPALLAVDLGLRTGFAAYARDGRLVWARSQNLGTRTRLRAAAASVLNGLPGVERLVLEGGGDLARLWAAVAEKRGLAVRVVDAQTWRRTLLLPREQRSGTDAKAAADGLARAVIAWSGAAAPKGALRHDAAEAVAVGLWGVIDAGWLAAVPEAVRRR